MQATFNIGAAPYVSDYSRYLPRRTSRWKIIGYVFAGSALSAIWLIALGGWLATHFGAADGLISLRQAGDAAERAAESRRVLDPKKLTRPGRA